eukprot:47791-Rhodomonas_salina.1
MGIGATDLSLCTSCQDASSTSGVGGQISQDACVCDSDTYLAVTGADTADEKRTCVRCPRGARCADEVCALSTYPDLNCSDGTEIVGEWVVDSTTSRYQVTSCKAGFELVTAAELTEVLQECKPCSDSQYILRPGLDACQRCPPGLICDGTDEAEPVVPGSTWVKTGSYFNLTSCPS